MSIAFSEIIAGISEYKLIQTVNDHLNASYLRGQLLTDRQTHFFPGTIYVGKASQVLFELHQQEDIGLILINDCKFDFSKLKGNAAELPLKTDLFSLFNDVLDLLNNKRKIIESSAALLNCLVQGMGLNDIINISAKLVGNTVSLVDYTGKQLAVSDIQEANSTSRVGMTPDGYPTQEIYSIFRSNKYTKRVNESSVPILVDSDHPEIPRMIVGKIAFRNKIVGHLAIIENEQPITEDDIEIAKVLVDVIAAIVQKDNYYLLMAGIQHEYFILDLIQENHDNPTTIEDRVRSLQWDGYKDFYVVTISIPRKSDEYFFVEYLRTRLGHIFPFSKSIYHDENVILVIYKEQDVQEILKKIESILVENNLAAGISLRFSFIVDLKRHYEQAKQALGIGKLLNKDDNVFLYDDLYMYDLLSILNRNANLKDFCHPGIEKIIKYDNDNGTDYYKTLFEYLMGSANMAQVAKKLHIHRNTLYHRINKISEITDLNLDDGDDYLKILLSFKIIELYNVSSDLEM